MELGQGSYSTVRVLDNNLVIKKFKRRSDSLFYREIIFSEFMYRAGYGLHVESYDAEFGKIVLQRADKTLKDYYKEKQDDIDLFPIFRRIIEMVYHMHSHGFVHFDLKPANILMIGDIPYIIDYNLVDFVDFPHKVKDVQTLWYRAPEFLDGSQKPDYSADMWSIGMIFLELIYRKPICRGLREEDYKKSLEVDLQPAIDKIENPALRKIIGELCQFSPKLRPSCRDLLERLNINVSPKNNLQLYQSSNSEQKTQIFADSEEFHIREDMKQALQNFLSTTPLPEKYGQILMKFAEKYLKEEKKKKRLIDIPLQAYARPYPGKLQRGECESILFALTYLFSITYLDAYFDLCALNKPEIEAVDRAIGDFLLEFGNVDIINSQQNTENIPVLAD